MLLLTLWLLLLSHGADSSQATVVSNKVSPSDRLLLTLLDRTAWVIDGKENPIVILNGSLTDSVIHEFKISPSRGFHPFWIRTKPSLGVDNAFTKGVLDQTNGLMNGTVKLQIPPASSPVDRNRLYYNCQFHKEMRGIIRIRYPER